MGYNCTVVVLHDALSYIEQDPEFGRKLAAAITRSFMGESPTSLKRDVSARVPGGGVYVNAAYVVESHHADHNVLVSVGRNTGEVITDHQAVFDKYSKRVRKKP
jgi:hypothetical protein